MEESQYVKMKELANLNGTTIEESTNGYGISEEQLLEFEKLKGGVKFPNAYRDFLQEYGSWFQDFEVKGCYKDALGNIRLDVEEDCEYYKSMGLKDGDIVLEDAGEFAYVLNLSDGGVYIWDKFGNEIEGKPDYEDFNMYFIERLEDRLEDYR